MDIDSLIVPLRKTGHQIYDDRLVEAENGFYIIV